MAWCSMRSTWLISWLASAHGVMSEGRDGVKSTKVKTSWETRFDHSCFQRCLYPSYWLFLRLVCMLSATSVVLRLEWVVLSRLLLSASCGAM